MRQSSITAPVRWLGNATVTRQWKKVKTCWSKLKAWARSPLQDKIGNFKLAFSKAAGWLCTKAGEGLWGVAERLATGPASAAVDFTKAYLRGIPAEAAVKLADGSESALYSCLGK
jgi:hypothetical protein